MFVKKFSPQNFTSSLDLFGNRFTSFRSAAPSSGEMEMNHRMRFEFIVNEMDCDVITKNTNLISNQNDSSRVGRSKPIKCRNAKKDRSWMVKLRRKRPVA